MNKMKGIQEDGAEDVNLDGTYTFEFYSQNLDLIGWKLFNIPILPEVSLSRFASSWPRVPIPCSGFVATMREMGDEARKFDLDEPREWDELGSVINVHRGKT